jgi:hypothetical protein
MHVNLDQADEETDLLLRLKATPEIFDLIRQSSSTELAGQKKLRERFDQELVRAALSVQEARTKAIGNLPQAEQLWLTRIGLEQSTAWEVARHKAQRFAMIPQAYDLCCGIGVDAANMATGCDVIAIDNSPSMCVRSAWNAEIWGTGKRLEARCQDVSHMDWAGKIVHIDPDRRADSDRPAKRLEHYQPNLEWMQKLTRTATGGGIKVGPASNFLQKFPDCEIELISLHGECREATVWFGSLAGEFQFRATTLPTGESISADPLSAWTNTTPQVGAYVFDPDPAIVRSGLLDVMAEQNQLLRLDPEEEYLTGDHVPQTAFVTAFQVEAVLSNNVKELKQHLKLRPSQYYEVKCRRIPTEANVVRRQLPTGDEPPRVIIFARISGRAAIVVARRVVSPTPVV